jgi:polyribonucleotide nucleotidyltransferase
MNDNYETAVDTFSVKFSTGTLAKQANGAVWVTSGAETILVTATPSKVLRPFIRGLLGEIFCRWAYAWWLS